MEYFFYTCRNLDTGIMDNSVFNTFPLAPADNDVTICEQNGQLVTSSTTEHVGGSKVRF